MTRNTEWQLWAACRDEDPELFFPATEYGPGAVQVQQAKAVCAGCQVPMDCLATAMKNGETDGVYGGMSAAERRELQRDRAATRH